MSKFYDVDLKTKFNKISAEPLSENEFCDCKSNLFGFIDLLLEINNEQGDDKTNEH